MKKRFFFSAIAILFITASAIATPVQRIHEIRKPLFNIPAIVQNGKTFSLEITTGEKRKVISVALYPIDQPGKSIPLTMKPVSAAGGNQAFDVDIPAAVPEALYDLAVQFDDNQMDYQPHSVKVIKQFKSEFDFIQITDIHFNVQDFKAHDMNRMRRYILKEASSKKPEFIIFTGDLGLEPPTYDWDYVYGYDQFVESLRVPVYMVPGNHEMYYDKIGALEIDGSLNWAATYGPIHHSFDYGKTHFIGVGDYDPEAWPAPWRMRRSHDAMFFGTVLNAAISDRQWKWIQDDLAASKSRGLGCVAYAHIPIETLQGGRRLGAPAFKVQGPGKDAFVKTLADAGCEYLFVGHNHVTKTNVFGPLTEELTGAAGAGVVEGKWSYRVIHVKNGKVTGSKVIDIRFEEMK